MKVKPRKRYQGKVTAVRAFADGWLAVTVEIAGLDLTVHIDPTTAEDKRATMTKKDGTLMTDYHAVQDCYAHRLPRAPKPITADKACQCSDCNKARQEG